MQWKNYIVISQKQVPKWWAIVDKSSYTFDESKSVMGESFCGLPLDEDSESDLTDSRLETWASQLKGEIPSLG